MAHLHAGTLLDIVTVRGPSGRSQARRSDGRRRAMALHRMNSVTIGVPDVDGDVGVLPRVRADGDEARRVRDAGRRRAAAHRAHAGPPPGRSLDRRRGSGRHRPRRVAARRASASTPQRAGASVSAVDGGTGVNVRVEIAPQIVQARRARDRRTTGPAASTARAARRACARTTRRSARGRASSGTSSPARRTSTPATSSSRKASASRSATA